MSLAAKRGVAITIVENRLSRVGAVLATNWWVTPSSLSGGSSCSSATGTSSGTGEHTTGDLLYDFDLSDIECDIRRLKPSHTEVVFYYLEPQD